MAKEFLDYAGLARYNDLIQALIKSGDNELLAMINDLKDLVEGSDADAASVDERIAALKDAIDNKIDTLETSLEGKIDDAINGVIDGAPEILDTLKEVADWIASDEAGVADLISKVAANREDIVAAANAFAELDDKVDSHDTRLAVVEALVGAAGDSEADSLADRIDALEDKSHDEPTAITDAEIDALFV